MRKIDVDTRVYLTSKRYTLIKWLYFYDRRRENFVCFIMGLVYNNLYSPKNRLKKCHENYIIIVTKQGEWFYG